MVKYCFFVVSAFFALSKASFCQDQRVVDSLRVVLEHQSGGEMFPALYELAFQYVHTDHEQALEIIQQAEAAALLAGDSLWIVKSRRVRGQILYKLERIEEAIEILDNALPCAQRNGFETESTGITSALGSSYLFTGKFDYALQYYFRSFELSAKSHDSKDLCGALNNIGLAYYKLSDYKRALRYFKKSLEAAKIANQIDSDVLTNISLCYSYLQNFRNARFYLEESLKACGSDCPLQHKMSIFYARGLILFGLKEFEKAEKYFKLSYSMARETGNSRYQLDNIYYLTEINLTLDRISEAELYLQKAEVFGADALPYNFEIIKLYSRFYKLYLSIEDYKSASDYQEKYIQLKDSIFSYELMTNLMKVEAQFLERENVARLSAQNEVLALKEEVIGRQRILNWVAGLLAIISVSFLALLFRNYQNKRRLNTLLDQKIRERTHILKRTHDDLERTFEAIDWEINRTSQRITDASNNIKSLCLIGMREVSDPVARTYIRQIDVVAGQLRGYKLPVLDENGAFKLDPSCTAVNAQPLGDHGKYPI